MITASLLVAQVIAEPLAPVAGNVNVWFVLTSTGKLRVALSPEILDASVIATSVTIEESEKYRYGLFNQANTFVTEISLPMVNVPNKVDAAVDNTTRESHFI